MISRAEQFNRECACAGVDVAGVRRLLGASLGESHAHLFSELPVFLEPAHDQAIRALVAAVERVVALPAYQAAVLGWAPPIARAARASRGVFTAFDFHVSATGPRLIEINSNGGGGLLNAVARAAHEACCELVRDCLRNSPASEDLRQGILDMFGQEWRLARGDQPLRHVAIVDEEPRQQFLYPEFELFQQLFATRGIEAAICDPRELRVSADGLWRESRRIDLVYNRSTDFSLAADSHAALAQAYERDLAVVTPHPRAHALYADKRNLTLLGDAGFLAGAGVGPADVAALTAMVPRTVLVDADERWWRDRRHWFFKPRAGFGSRGSYRGDKLTRRVFADIISGHYVAQEFTPPSERRGRGEPGGPPYKVDVRAYAYAGEVQQYAARLYRGQTTNFRTEGGGFAPVYVLPPR